MKRNKELLILLDKAVPIINEWANTVPDYDLLLLALW